MCIARWRLIVLSACSNAAGKHLWTCAKNRPKHYCSCGLVSVASESPENAMHARAKNNT